MPLPPSPSDVFSMYQKKIFQKHWKNIFHTTIARSLPQLPMAALENFRRMEVLHKMVILGDMKELGKSSHEEHQKIVSYIDECKFERVILVGEEFGQATSSYEHYQDARQLSEVLKKSKPKGFYILIKGSNSMKLAPLQELL